ncbi:uncharacterized protein [Ptychodera flava]|uniref:uncharacterized protein n=1 Tax=Ptychodera flava TaxID=63121 RepID=UPI00396A256C
MERRNDCFRTEVSTEFTLDEVEDILDRASDDNNICINEPPVRPQGGDVYLYKARSKEEERDFRFDQYRWISKGCNIHSKRDNNPPVRKRYYYLKDPNGKGKDSLSGFKRHVYNIVNRERDDAPLLFLIHYIGDASLHKDTNHGNSKSTCRRFIPVKRKVLHDIKEKVNKGVQPINVYKDMQSEMSTTVNDQRRMPVDRPRNLKQVENVAHSVRRDGRLTNDEIFSLSELAIHLDGFIWSINLYPDLVVVLGRRDLLENTTEMLRMSLKHSDLPQLLSYDTTFTLGDFYVSPLVIRNVLLKGDPIYPVGFLLHERKFKAYHDEFLNRILSELNISKGMNIPIVTDRERGITKAIQNNFPSITNVYCGNHVLKDVESWVKNHAGGQQDIKVLKDDVEQLRDATNVEQFEMCYRRFSLRWSAAFKAYFDRELKYDLLKHGSKIITSGFPAFRGQITATNNISESMNKLIKEQNEWK